MNTIVTKRDAAHRQLCTAIRMYFANDDVVAIHTLVCAAREIYEKHCAMAGVKRMFDSIKTDHPDKSDKTLWDAINGARNFIKHPDQNGDLNASIVLTDADNRYMLFYACQDCERLCKDNQPVEVQVFNLWFVATEPQTAEGILPGLDANEALQLDAKFSGLRAASVPEQKQRGLRLLAETVAGEFQRVVSHPTSFR